MQKNALKHCREWWQFDIANKLCEGEREREQKRKKIKR